MQRYRKRKTIRSLRHGLSESVLQESNYYNEIKKILVIIVLTEICTNEVTNLNKESHSLKE